MIIFKWVISLYIGAIKFIWNQVKEFRIYRYEENNNGKIYIYILNINIKCGWLTILTLLASLLYMKHIKCYLNEYLVGWYIDVFTYIITHFFRYISERLYGKKQRTSQYILQLNEYVYLFAKDIPKIFQIKDFDMNFTHCQNDV